jgi:hypothetical protein
MENVVRDAAEVGRAGELVRVGKPEFFSDFNNPRCPSGEMASVEVSYSTLPEAGLVFVCYDGGSWTVESGPLYGE